MSGARYASMYERLCAWVVLEGDCWTWVGKRRRHGGGQRPAINLRIDGKHCTVNACRLMCELVHGPAPSLDHDASHLCDDNWLCVNPDHVLWETKAQNRARMWARRRAEDVDVYAGVSGDNEVIPF